MWVSRPPHSANGATFFSPTRAARQPVAGPPHSANGAVSLSPAHPGWVNGQPAMHEPCKGGIEYVAPQCHSSPRKARCWREAKSASSLAKDARCDAFNRSTADTWAANSRWRGNGGTGIRSGRNVSRLMFARAVSGAWATKIGLQNRRTRSIYSDEALPG